MYAVLIFVGTIFFVNANHKTHTQQLKDPESSVHNACMKFNTHAVSTKNNSII